MRKRIARELPKVEQELKVELGNWEEEYGRPYLVFGERYLEVIESMNARAPPPRSKTPNGMQPPSRAGARTAPQPQRAGGTSRGPPPPRSKTPGLDTSTMSRSAMASSIRSEAPASLRGVAAPPPPTSNNRASPSRIPARVPLGNMPHGSNSPERRQGSPQAFKGQENHARAKPGHPTMAPPPKMRDLYAPPSASTPSHDHPDDIPRSGSIVRNITPEDPYSDHSHFQNAPPGRYDSDMMLPPPRPHPQPHSKSHQHRHGSHADAMSVASGTTHSTASRQISNTSSAAASTASSHTTAASGSENWETFEDSECEDAYAIPTQPHRTETWAVGGKRANPHPHAQYGQQHGQGYPGAQMQALHAGAGYAMNKKMRGMGPGMGMAGHHGAAGAVETIVEGGAERQGSGMVGGSDAGWTDDDVY